MRFIVTLLAAAMVLAPISQSFADVHSVKSSATHYVRVSPVNGLVRFEYCDNANTDCKLLGKRDYSLYELRTIRQQLLVTEAGVVAVDVALLGASAIFGLGGGVVLGVYLGVTTETGIVIAAYTGSAWAVASTGHMVRSVRTLNPIRRLAEARSVRYRVVNDKDAKVWNVEKFAARLNATLLHLN